MPCDFCGDHDHVNKDCPQFRAAREAPVTLDMDPYETYNPQTRIGMRQLELAEEAGKERGATVRLLEKLILRMDEQGNEIRALRTGGMAPALPGPQMRALPANASGRCGFSEDDGPKCTYRPEHPGPCSWMERR